MTGDEDSFGFVDMTDYDIQYTAAQVRQTVLESWKLLHVCTSAGTPARCILFSGGLLQESYYCTVFIRPSLYLNFIVARQA